ncbi:hypothetical protein AB0H88_18830 [Nonomuraea sp. NPDC050680]|uniref:hypothetical protein n=1 Tax=Nonomuraea sp. NPDC050680 TaxID=3154630 RepID=UPI0033CAFED5
MSKQLPVARAYSVDPLDAGVNGVDEGERHGNQFDIRAKTARWQGHYIEAADLPG